MRLEFETRTEPVLMMDMETLIKAMRIALEAELGDDPEMVYRRGYHAGYRAGMGKKPKNWVNRRTIAKLLQNARLRRIK